MCEYLLEMEVLDEGCLVLCPDCGEEVFVSYEDIEESIYEDEEDFDDFDEYLDEDELIWEMIDEDIVDEIICLKEKMEELREDNDMENYLLAVKAYQVLINM